MKLIVAVDKNWGIGKEGDLLTSIPDDMRFFRETTQRHVLVMGSKTLRSFKNSRPLPGRLNIVLTRRVIHESKMRILRQHDRRPGFVLSQLRRPIQERRLQILLKLRHTAQSIAYEICDFHRPGGCCPLSGLCFPNGAEVPEEPLRPVQD